MSIDHRSADQAGAAGTGGAADGADRATAATPPSGDLPLRRPRDGRRAARGRNPLTGALSLGGRTRDTSTTSVPLRGAGSAAPGSTGTSSGRDGSATPATPGAVPPARSTGTPPSGVTGPIRQLLGPVTGSLRLGLPRNDGSTEQRLRVDWPQCKAHGLCAEIAPEIIHLDEWGYPMFDAGAVATSDLATAKKAVQVCPTLALRLVDLPPKS